MEQGQWPRYGGFTQKKGWILFNTESSPFLPYFIARPTQREEEA